MAASDRFGKSPVNASVVYDGMPDIKTEEGADISAEDFLMKFVRSNECYDYWPEMDVNSLIKEEDQSLQQFGEPPEPATTPISPPGRSFFQDISTHHDLNPLAVQQPQHPAPHEWSHIAQSQPFQNEPSSERSRYRNDVLNGFKNAAMPLKIIDHMKYPFDERLRQALEKELRRQATVRRNTSGQDYMPGSKNNRSMNNLNFNPREHYQPLLQAPEAWGPIDPDTHEPIFKYTKYGELMPGSTFTVDQMITYLAQHPLHHNCPDKRHSRLRLWIQGSPADSKRRYPHKDSMKCRFKDCANPTRGINKGMFRVCFDEQSWTDPVPTLDPYHNAGYVHLYCLEKFVDFPSLCKEFNVKADVRALPEEDRNRMAINRDHESMEAIARDYIEYSAPWSYVPGGRPPGHDWYPMSLCSLLTEEHMRLQPPLLQAVRARRGGNNLDIHRNNLDLFALGEAQKLRERKLGRPKAKKDRSPSHERFIIGTETAADADEDDENSEPKNYIMNTDIAQSYHQAAKRTRHNRVGLVIPQPTIRSPTKRRRGDQKYDAVGEGSGVDSMQVESPQNDQPSAKRPRLDAVGLHSPIPQGAQGGGPCSL